jgi:cytochrome c
MRNSLFVAVVTVMSAALPFAAHASEDLAKKAGCTACHANDKRIIGPSYADVAKKYKGDAKAEAALADKVRKGGSGVWGAIPMPANTAVSDADLKSIIKWVLTVK